jgi:hypothetical protein
LYVEGVAVEPINGEVIMHAWNAVRNEAVDSTWLNTGLFYLGVEFSVERGDDATWNGDGCVLNDEHRNYPVFHERWQGEDYTRTWPYSDRLDALRRARGVIPESVQQWLDAGMPKPPKKEGDNA